MRRYPKWARVFLRILMALFALTEEAPEPCGCPHCKREREKFEGKRRTKGAT